MKYETPQKEYYQQSSERLTFRSLTEPDIAMWSRFFENNPTERFLGGAKLGSTPMEKATTWISKQIERKRDNQFGQLAVIEKESGNLIGLGGIIERELEGLHEYEVTYSLFPDSWGKGYATELAVHFKNFAFENIDTPTVISMIHVENEASINVAKKNGMTYSSETSFLEMRVAVYRIVVPEV